MALRWVDEDEVNDAPVKAPAPAPVQSGSAPRAGIDVEQIMQSRGTPEDLRPIVRGIFAQESRSGSMDTSNPNYAGARGPMQVLQPTFQQMQAERRIPRDYRWDDPTHSAEAGVAYVEAMGERFNNSPDAVLASYYGGPGAVNADGTIQTDRRDPRNPNAPTVGQYVAEARSKSGLPPATPAAASNAPAGKLVWDDEPGDERYGWDPIDPNQSSKVGAFVRGAVGMAIPAAAGITVGSAGAGATTFVGGPVLGFAGGLAAGVAAGAATAKAQEELFQEYPSLARMLGQDPTQRAYDEALHPYSLFAGQLAPNLAAFRPSALPLRNAANLAARTGQTVEQAQAAITGARLGAGINAGTGAGLELGMEVAHDQPVDLTKVAMAGALGLVANKPWLAGPTLLRAGESILPPSMRNFTPPEPEAPTYRDMMAREQEAARGPVQTLAEDAPVGTQGELFSTRQAPIREVPSDTPASAFPAPTVERPAPYVQPVPNPADAAPAPRAQYEPLPQQEPMPELPGQQDLFGASPTSTVVTDFGPSQVLRMLRAYGGSPDKPAAASTVNLRLSKLISDALSVDDVDGVAVREALDAEIERANEQLAIVTEADVALQAKGSGQAPGKADGWQKQRKQLDAKRKEVEETIKTLGAADDAMPEILRLFKERTAGAYGEQAAPKVQTALDIARARQAAGETAGVKVDKTQPVESVTAEEMAARNAQDTQAQAEAVQREAIRVADERVAQAEAAKQAKVRDDILQRVLDDPTTQNPTGRFRAELRKAGVKDVNPSPEEVAKIGRFEDAKAAFPAEEPTVTPVVEDTLPTEPPVQKNYLDLESQIKERKAPAQAAPAVAERSPGVLRLDTQSPADFEAMAAAQARRDAKAAAQPDTTDYGPAPKQGELFTKRGEPTKQAQGSTQQQLVSEANRLIAELTGTKSKALMDEAVAAYGNREVGVEFLIDTAQKLKARRFAEAKKGLELARQARVEEPVVEPVADVAPEPKVVAPPEPPVPPTDIHANPESPVAREVSSLKDVAREAHRMGLLDNGKYFQLIHEMSKPAPDLNMVRTAVADAARGAGKPKAAAETPVEKPPVDPLADDPALPMDERMRRQQARADRDRPVREAARVAKSEAAQDVGLTGRMRFSEPSNEPATPVLAKDVESDVARVTDGWRANLNVRTVQRAEDLPPDVLAKVREQGQERSPGFVTEDGTVHLIADNMSSREDGVGTLYHETLGHLGLGDKFRSRLDQVLDQMYRGNAKLRADTDAWVQANPNAYAGNRTRAVEEVLANRSRNGAIEASAFAKLKAVIKDFARRAGIKLDFSDSEINAILAMAHKRVTGGKGPSGPSGTRFTYVGEKAAMDADTQQMLRAAKTWDVMAAKQGINDTEAIRKTTGWRKGIDNQWRREISDHAMVIDNDAIRWVAGENPPNRPGSGTYVRNTENNKLVRIVELPNVMQHDTLFDAYPQLRKIKVIYDPSPDRGGYFAGNGVKELGITDPVIAISSLGDATTPNWFKTVMTHEVQHWIQSHEGFDTGRHPDDFADLNVLYGSFIKGEHRSFFEKMSNALKAGSLLALQSRNKKATYNYEKLRRFGVPENVLYEIKYGEDGESATLIDNMLKLAADGKKPGAVYAMMKELDRNIPLKRTAYYMSHGEAEARDAQYRMDWTEQDRANNAPFTGERVKDAASELIRSPENGEVGYRSVWSPRPDGEVGSPKEVVRRRAEAVDSAIDRAPVRLQSPLRAIYDNVAYGVKRGITTWGFTENIAADAAEAGVKSAKRYVDVNAERTKIASEREQKVEEILAKVDPLPAAERQKINQYLQLSTHKGEWGYQPDYISEKVKIDPELAVQLKGISDEGQEVIKAVFKHGAETLKLKQDGVVRTIADEFSHELGLIDAENKTTYKKQFDASLKAGVDTDSVTNVMEQLLKAAKGTPAETEIRKLRGAFASKITTFESMMKIRPNTPYAPLKRDGNYVATGMSKQLLAAEQAVEKGTMKLAELEALKSSPEHYFVDFYDTMGAANAAADKLQGNYPHTEAFAKDEAYNRMGQGRDAYLSFQRIQRMLLDAGDTFPDKKSLNSVRRLVSDLYLRSLAETSARKSELHRLKVASGELDMLRAFATQGRADAHLLANLHKNGELLDTMSAMRDEVRSREMPEKRGERQMYFNELLRRYANGMAHTNSRTVDGINRATSLWMLATSPSYYLQNLSQPVMMSLPYMAGTHGYFRSSKLLADAYGDLTGMVKSAELTQRMDLTKVPEDVKPVIEDLVKRGRIDIGFDQDLGKWRSYSDSQLGTAWNTVDQKLRIMAQKVETINRLSTAIAGYRAAKGRGMSNDAALQYADELIRMTHGSYDGFNAPRYLNTPAGKVLGQFRKFQLIQLSMMAKLFRNSFKGGEEAAAARKALALVAGHTSVMGGMLGLPGMAAFKFLLEAAISDDDDPVNVELAVRRTVKDPGLSDLILRGVPTTIGLDLSGKFGMGQMLSPVPFSEPAMSRDGYASVAVSALGPFFGGVVPRMAEGLGQVFKGDYYKGLEQMLPTGFGAALKGYRYASEGVTQRNGDVVLSPEELSLLGKFSTALGLPSVDVTNRRFSQQVVKEFDEGFRSAASEIKSDYVKARQENDTAALAEARNAWQRLQDARAKNGFKRQPMSELIKAERAKRQRESKVAGGVEYTPQTKEIANELATLTGM